jgi:hypothetical protein
MVKRLIVMFVLSLVLLGLTPEVAARAAVPGL